MDVADEMNSIFGDKDLSARHYFNDRTGHLHSQATFLNHHNFIAVMDKIFPTLTQMINKQPKIISPTASVFSNVTL
jgi:hypothetical protein